MSKFKSYHVETKIGSGQLDIVEKSAGSYFATYHGLSGQPHQITHGCESPVAANIDFQLSGKSYENLIEKCLLKIAELDSEVLSIESSPVYRGMCCFVAVLKGEGDVWIF